MKWVSLAQIMIVAMLGVTAASGQSRSPSQAEVVAAAFSAEVTGTVKSVDDKSGKLVLDTPGGPVNVTFPAEAIQGIKQGDEVTVAFGLIKPPPSASPKTAPGTK